MPFLDWVNKHQAKAATGAVPTHLLKQEAVYGGSEDSPPENLIIQGDNLLALKALIPVYAGRVKCIFIDPPYNTQSAFEHYDDKLEHSQWLSMMYPRLVLLRDLLAEDGSIWVTIDDNEAHYLKVLMDEVFGRANFVANVVWEKVYTPKSNGRGLSGDHDHLLVFARSSAWLERGWNLVPRSVEQQGRFKNPDNDPDGPWRTYPLDVRTEDSARREKYRYEVKLPSGRVVKPAQGRHWALPKEQFEKERAAGAIYFGKDGNATPTKKVHLKNAKQGVIARTWWTYKEVGGNQDAKRELLGLMGDTDFITPKPERLIQQVLTIASNTGDIILDSYLGSGTTAAVAHKMKRRYIGIEMGEHARTHCVPRLQKVIDGEQGGISEAVGWKGGGGFRFCTLGQAAFDADGRINPEVRFGMLAAFIWHYETAAPAAKAFNKPLLDRHNGTAYYLLYNGILGDRRPQGGNVLTHAVLQMLKEKYPHDGPKVIYGETTRLGDAKLAAEGVTFKQIPYDVRVR
jgi:adenine-specific DNA-methyltransferase